jgi:hypothetical protein
VAEGAIASIVLSIPFLAWSIVEIYLGLETAGWRAVPGEVVESLVEEQTFMDDDPWTATTLFRTGWMARVMYKYSVRGKEYVGDTINRRHMHSIFKLQAAWRASRYESGQEVTVYVSPRNPSLAVLARGACATDYAMLALGASLLMVAKILS